MQEKDLFTALSYVDDTLIEEAETYAVRKVLPLHMVRWFGALAACLCLLFGWAVAARWAPFAAMSDKSSMEKVSQEAAAEAMPEEEWVEAEKAETEDAKTEGVMMEETEKGSAYGSDVAETPEAGTGPYVILNDAPPIFKNDAEVLYADPLNGTVIVAEDLQKTADQCKLAQMARSPRFLITFDLYRDGEKLETSSKAYLQEIARLEEQGYSFRYLVVKKRDKSVAVQGCWLMTSAQLNRFAASEEYGYFLYFPQNEDGTPLNWKDKADLNGLPTVEDALVTKE